MNKNDILKSNLKAVSDAVKDIREFVDSIIDADSFVETDVFTAGSSFVSGAEAAGEGVLTGYATLNGSSVQIFAQNANVMKGSLGAAHAKKIVKTIKRAVKADTPLISVIDSSGARIGEGVSVLEGYAEIIAAASELKAYGIPHIAIIKGNAIGLNAAFSQIADFVFMAEKGAVISMTSPMVHIAKELKDFPKFDAILGYGAHKAENRLANFGYKNNSDLKSKIAYLTEVVLRSNQEVKDNPNREAAALNKAVTPDALLKAICDDGKWLEFSADTALRVKCILTKINGMSAGLVLSVSEDKLYSACAIEKTADFVSLLDKYNIPLITLVDFGGIKSTIESEKTGLAAKAANLCYAIANSEMPKISVVTGKAIGMIYSMLVSKGMGFDYSLAFPDADIAPMNGDTAVNIIYADDLKKAKDPVKAREKLADQYNKLHGDAFVSAKDGYIDNIIMPSAIRPYLASALLMLEGV